MGQQECKFFCPNGDSMDGGEFDGLYPICQDFQCGDWTYCDVLYRCVENVNDCTSSCDADLRCFNGQCLADGSAFCNATTECADWSDEINARCLDVAEEELDMFGSMILKVSVVIGVMIVCIFCGLAVKRIRMERETDARRRRRTQEFLSSGEARQQYPLQPTQEFLSSGEARQQYPLQPTANNYNTQYTDQYSENSQYARAQYSGPPYPTSPPPSYPASPIGSPPYPASPIGSPPYPASPIGSPPYPTSPIGSPPGTPPYPPPPDSPPYPPLLDSPPYLPSPGNPPYPPLSDNPPYPTGPISESPFSRPLPEFSPQQPPTPK